MSFCCVFLLCGDWEGKLPQLTVGNFTDSWLFLHLLPSFGSGLRRFPQESGFFVIIGGLNCYLSDACKQPNLTMVSYKNQNSLLAYLCGWVLSVL